MSAIYRSAFQTDSAGYTFGRVKVVLVALALVLVIGAFLSGKVLLLHLTHDVPIGNLTRDPAAVGGLPVYTGYLSQIGILLWSAAAAVCLFSAASIKNGPSSRDFRSFLVCSGLLTLLLGVDDTFLLHEEVFPRAGIPEKLVFASYAGIACLYLVRFWDKVLQTEFLLLAFALSLFGFSVTMDAWIPFAHSNSSDDDLLYLLEDGAKPTGVLSWFAYLFLVSRRSIQAYSGQTKTDFSGLTH
jgi:hypothetical protein